MGRNNYVDWSDETSDLIFKHSDGKVLNQYEHSHTGRLYRDEPGKNYFYFDGHHKPVRADINRRLRYVCEIPKGKIH